jgi:hypothetical protein
VNRSKLIMNCHQDEENDKIEEGPKSPKSPRSPKSEERRYLFWVVSANIVSFTHCSLTMSHPYNIVHKSHVDFDYQWSGQDVDKAFNFQEKLGQG